jgi:hypothetical protein
MIRFATKDGAIIKTPINTDIQRGANLKIPVQTGPSAPVPKASTTDERK